MGDRKSVNFQVFNLFMDYYSAILFFQ